MKKNLFLLLCFSFLACACSSPLAYLTSEPSIERSLDVIESTKDGKALVKFLEKNPVQIEYAETAGICHHFSLKNEKHRMIFVPEEYRRSDKLLAMAVLRAAHIYRYYMQTGLDEIIAEEEELAMLRQMHLGVELGVVKEEFDLVPEAYEMKREFCAYLLEDSREALAQTRHIVQTAMPACQRPLENIVKQEIWLDSMIKSINDDTFHQVLANRDRRRVNQGLITDSQAAENSAKLRALPSYELTRYERTFYDDKKANFRAFNEMYAAEIASDSSFRRANAERIFLMATDFAECDIEQLRHQKD
ncbi:MAG: hypothetical protein J6Z08_01805 [Elusimicrobiales bacterium]|jgi:hypothetical protein|nr:hypothetical protein [Elusimicrobiales bacterium]